MRGLPASLALTTALMLAGIPALAESTPAGDEVAEIDPDAFFDALIERYRRLERYRDVVDAEYVTIRDGAAPHEVRSRLVCQVEADRLRVVTAGAQVRGGLGVDVSLNRSPAVEALVMRYNLWLAPHLTLKFADDPRQEFRLGVAGGVRAEDARPLERGGRAMVQLVLVEPVDAEAPAGTPARFVLYVNAETLLVERVEGEQVLPDGARYTTVLDITPRDVEPRRPGDSSQVIEIVG